MQLKKLSAPLTAMTIAVATAFSLPRPNLVQAQSEPIFFCDTSGNVPVTVVRSEFKNYGLINWIRDTGGVNPEQRCHEVSARFEQFDKIGYLNILKTGVVNGQYVICGLQLRSEYCNDSNVLITLEPHDNPYSYLQKLLKTRNTGNGGNSEIYMSPQITPMVGEDGFPYINFKSVIDILIKGETYVLPQD